jgi:hypothetical protein
MGNYVIELRNPHISDIHENGALYEVLARAKLGGF